jgi:hypothetical protein
MNTLSIHSKKTPTLEDAMKSRNSGNKNWKPQKHW